MKRSLIIAFIISLLFTASLASAKDDRCAMPFLCADPFGQIYFSGLTEAQCTALKEKYGNDVNRFCEDLRNNNITIPDLPTSEKKKG